MAVRRPHQSNVGEDFEALVAVVNTLAVSVNELQTKFLALLTKLNADGGVTDVNYVSLLTPASAANDTIVLSY